MLFDSRGRGLCLIDLDTLTLMSWPLEMGDALRSWCNPTREDGHALASFDLELFEAAVQGYRRTAGGLTCCPASRGSAWSSLHGFWPMR